MEIAATLQLSNLYLKEKGKRPLWKEAEETFRLADYACHKLETSGHYVVRKNLPYKIKGKPPKHTPYLPKKID